MPVEDLVRHIANQYTNSYQIAIFTNSTKSQCSASCVQKPTLEEGRAKPKEVAATGSVKVEDILKTPQAVKSRFTENFGELYSSGNILAPKMHCKNIIFISNTKDWMKRGGKSYMVGDLVNTLLKRLDRESLSIQFPDVIS